MGLHHAEQVRTRSPAMSTIPPAPLSAGQCSPTGRISLWWSCGKDLSTQRITGMPAWAGRGTKVGTCLVTDGGGPERLQNDTE